MANISSLGIGTGVDLQKMLTTIMAAERAPLTAIENKISSANTKISAYGTISSRLDTLGTAANTLSSPSQMSAVSASSSDATILGASASFTAAIGSYSMEVTQLASAQKSFSNSYASGTTFGAGELTFSVGNNPATNKTVQIAADSNLTQVSSSINSAKIGVTATVVTSDDGSQRMILTGEKSGKDNVFSITSSTATPTSGSSLTAFDTTTPGLIGSNAQDAKMKIDGIEVSSSTNTFSAAIAGLTLTAKKTGTVDITTKNDAEKIKTSVQAFVDAFNGVSTSIKSNSGYDSVTKTGQALTGDSTVRTVLSMLNSARTNIPSSLSGATVKNLSEIGITIQQNGQIKLDSTKLETAINNSPNDVTNLLKAYGESFSNTVNSLQSTDGMVSNRINGLKSSVTRFTDNKEAVENRLSLIEKRYRAQFTALDKYVNTMQTTSGYLGQQLAQLTSSS